MSNPAPKMRPARRFRKAVQSQIIEFKRQQLAANGALFSIPENRFLADEEASVDHTIPSFSGCLHDFLAATGYADKTPIQINRRQFQAMKSAWKDYHNEHAVPGLRVVSQSFNEFRATKEYRDLFQKGHDEGARGLPLNAAHYEIHAYAAAHTDGWNCGFAFYTGRKEAASGLAFMPRRFEDPLVQQSYRDGFMEGSVISKMIEMWGVK